MNHVSRRKKKQLIVLTYMTADYLYNWKNIYEIKYKLGQRSEKGRIQEGSESGGSLIINFINKKKLDGWFYYGGDSIIIFWRVLL